MAELVTILAMVLGGPVLNRMGFAGQLDIRVNFSPDESTLGLVGAGGPRDPGVFTPPIAAPDKPNIFSALQQQLGLRLGASKGPFEVLGNRARGEARRKLVRVRNTYCRPSRLARGLYN